MKRYPSSYTPVTPYEPPFPLLAPMYTRVYPKILHNSPGLWGVVDPPGDLRGTGHGARQCHGNRAKGAGGKTLEKAADALLF